MPHDNASKQAATHESRTGAKGEAQPEDLSPLSSATLTQRAHLNSRTQRPELTTADIMQLQRAVGNRRVQQLITQKQSDLPSPRTKPNLHQKDDETVTASVVPLTTAFDPAAKKAHHEASLSGTNVQFRIPDFESIADIYLAPEKEIPQDVIKHQVLWLLIRMQSEGRLKDNRKEPKSIIKEIFPKGGGINKKAFENYIDTSDRSIIYKNVSDAMTQIKGEDRPKLIQAIGASIVLINNASQNSSGLVAVFGSESESAKAIYKKAQAKLEKIRGDIDQYITTDYNIDSQEVGIGGGTDEQIQKLHLVLDIVQCKDENMTKCTLIHEACHLADASVVDHGYYGSPGFETMSERKKVTNAAHYEELPRRELGISSYLGTKFTEREDKSEAPLGARQKIMVQASEYLRKAWSTAATAYLFMRDFGQIHKADGSIGFGQHEALANAISEKLRLSIHRRSSSPSHKKFVTTLDIAGAESVAHAVNDMRNKLGSVSSGDTLDEVIKQVLKKDISLFKHEGDDIVVLNWLCTNYEKIPKITKETVLFEPQKTSTDTSEESSDF